MLSDAAAIHVIDSSQAVASQLLDQLDGMTEQGGGTTQFLATDGAQRFADVGSRFLGYAIDPDDVEIVDLHLV